jgi:protein-tyrosine phosphatase
MVESVEIPFFGEVNDEKVFLLELPHSRVPTGSDKLIQWLLDRKIRPMIAHPERNKDIMRKLDKIQPFVQMGCLFQLTSGSIAGSFGESALETSRNLLEMGCVTVIASDAHNLAHR